MQSWRKENKKTKAERLFSEIPLSCCAGAETPQLLSGASGESHQDSQIRGDLPHRVPRRSLQVAVTDELNALLRKHGAGSGQGQDAEFLLPRLAQAGGGGLQIRIVVAGVADEFPGALGNAAGNRVEQSFVERSRDFNAQCAVGRGEAFPVHCAAKTAGKPA